MAHHRRTSARNPVVAAVNSQMKVNPPSAERSMADCRSHKGPMGLARSPGVRNANKMDRSMPASRPAASWMQR